MGRGGSSSVAATSRESATTPQPQRLAELVLVVVCQLAFDTSSFPYLTSHIYLLLVSVVGRRTESSVGREQSLAWLPLGLASLGHLTSACTWLPLGHLTSACTWLPLGHLASA